MEAPRGAIPALAKAKMEEVLQIVELTEHVISFLPRGDVTNLALVDKRFKQIIQESPTIQQKLFLHPHPLVETALEINRRERSITGTKILALEKNTLPADSFVVPTGNNASHGSLATETSDTWTYCFITLNSELFPRYAPNLRFPPQQANALFFMSYLSTIQTPRCKACKLYAKFTYTALIVSPCEELRYLLSAGDAVLNQFITQPPVTKVTIKWVPGRPNGRPLSVDIKRDGGVRIRDILDAARPTVAERSLKEPMWKLAIPAFDLKDAEVDEITSAKGRLQYSCEGVSLFDLYSTRYGAE